MITSTGESSGSRKIIDAAICPTSMPSESAASLEDRAELSRSFISAKLSPLESARRTRSTAGRDKVGSMDTF